MLTPPRIPDPSALIAERNLPPVTARTCNRRSVLSEAAIDRRLSRTYRGVLASRYRALRCWVWLGDHMPAPGIPMGVVRASAGFCPVVFPCVQRRRVGSPIRRVRAGEPGGDGRGCLLWPCRGGVGWTRLPLC